MPACTHDNGRTYDNDDWSPAIDHDAAIAAAFDEYARDVAHNFIDPSARDDFAAGYRAALAARPAVSTPADDDCCDECDA